MSFEALDRWRERQRWLPAWLDDRPWKTWLWHGAIALAVGALVWAVTALPAVPFVWGARLGYTLYAWREYRNVRQLQREGKQLNPVDHAGDVLVAAVVVEAANWLLT